MTKFFTWFVLLMVSAIWGGAFALIKYLVSYVGPYELLVCRFVPTTILVLLWAILFYRRQFLGAFKNHLWVFLGLSLAWVITYHMMLNIGETVLPAAAAGLIISTYPAFTVLAAAIFRVEKLTLQRGLGGLVALVGTALLIILGAGEEAERINVTPMQWVLYSLITFAAPISAALTTLVTRHYLTEDTNGEGKINALVMTFAYQAPAGFFALAFFQPELIHKLAVVPVGFWIALGALVVFCTLLAHVGWFWALQHVEAGPAAISTYLIPIFSLAYSRLWLDEPIRFPTIIAAISIVIGVIISGYKKPNPHKSV